MPKFVTRTISQGRTGDDEIRNLIAPDKRIGKLVPIDEITPNPGQPRRHFDPDSLATLTESIRQHGLINPITVDENGRILAGERRYRACVALGMREVPVIRMSGSLEVSLVENLQRQDLHPLEEARGYQTLADAGYTHEQIAARIGKDRSVVTHSLRLLDLPADIQAECVTSHNVTKDQLLQILGADTPEQQRQIWEDIKAGKSARALKQERSEAKRRGQITPRVFINRVRSFSADAGKIDVARLSDSEKRTLKTHVEHALARLTSLLGEL
ncbi:MAG: Chromosome-partitioning protein Spo0J [Candidatus Latescibacteria bacterium ADurb.Bin168]|nr:MAG: Chromosome-partitioning protein Spo0J [Candidatus Latescibacteria bacterium ADurb.Bin168]